MIRGRVTYKVYERQVFKLSTVSTIIENGFSVVFNVRQVVHYAADVQREESDVEEQRAQRRSHGYRKASV